MRWGRAVTGRSWSTFGPDNHYAAGVTTARELGVEYKLPLADSVILATTWINQASLWTQDSDFQGLMGVKFKAKKV